MPEFYQEHDQKIYMFPEENGSYLKPLNGTAAVINPATYPWYEKLNVLKDGLDWDIPIILKEKLWDIGAGKHPSHIINTVQDPVDITLSMEMQDIRFLALATGTCSSAGSQKAVQTITVDTYSDYVDGDEFLIYAVDGSGHQIAYQVYMDVTGDDSGKPSAVTGATATRIDFVTGDSSNNVTTTTVTTDATLAAEIAAVLQALGTFTTVTSAAGVVTVEVPAATGAILNSRDNTGNTGVTTFSITTQGASVQTITESTGSSLPSFGLHIEQKNSGQDIIVDLYGCTVISHEMTIDYGEKTIKENVSIRASTFVIGNASTYLPPKRGISIHVWQNLVESASNNVIMDHTTDRTPAILNKLTLKIENEVDFHPEIGSAYIQTVVNGKRTITMNLVGFIQTNSVWTHWKDTWNDAADQYTNATGKLNSKIKVERTSTYDTWTISIYNWLIEEYDIKLFTIDDKILGIDVTFTDAVSDSNGYIIDSFVISDYVPKIFYNAVNA